MNTPHLFLKYVNCNHSQARFSNDQVDRLMHIYFAVTTGFHHIIIDSILRGLGIEQQQQPVVVGCLETFDSVGRGESSRED